jgi:hypothetical protein
MVLNTERRVIGKPISQLVELLMGTVNRTPEVINITNLNIVGLKNFLFTADTPENKPNAKLTTASIPT